ncbi:MAG: hypothetical protein WDZ93_00750 [Candidatus Paceibacterota bacterium]
MSTTTKTSKKNTVKRHRIVGLKELRANVDKYIEAVNQGVSFTVLRRSKPVFRIEAASDEWGDPVGAYETLVDFRELDLQGVPAKDVLKALKRLK